MNMINVLMVLKIILPKCRNSDIIRMKLVKLQLHTGLCLLEKPKLSFNFVNALISILIDIDCIHFAHYCCVKSEATHIWFGPNFMD